MIPGFNIVSGAARYIAPGVHFSKPDSSYISRAGGFWGVESKVFTLSLWFRTNDNTAQGNWLTDNLNGTFFRMQSDAKIGFNGFNDDAPATRLVAVSDAAVVLNNTWHHLLISVDMADSGKRHVYIDGASVAMTYSTYTNDHISFDRAVWNIARSNTGFYWDGDLADFWVDISYLDLSVAANRQKFIDASTPVYLGATGEFPTGSQPAFFFTKDSTNSAASTWNNAGSGGAGIHNGVITNSTRNPGQ